MSASKSLLRAAPAVRDLEQGCLRLGLREETAIELVRFLMLKRIHDAVLNPQDRQWDVSRRPGGSALALDAAQYKGEGVPTCGLHAPAEVGSAPRSFVGYVLLLP